MNSCTAQHYDKRAGETGAVRRKSKVLALRKANNAVKSVLLEQAVRETVAQPQFNGTVHVLDLGCGRGGDLPKWGALSAALDVPVCYYGIDISPASLCELQKRAETLQKRWPLLCVNVAEGDFCDVNGVRRNRWPLADIVSAQFALHYAFGAPQSAASLFELIDCCSKPKALFVGTVVNATQLARLLARTEHLEEHVSQVFAVASNAHFRARIDLPNLRKLVRANELLHSPSGASLPLLSTLIDALCGIEYFFSLDECIVDCAEHVVDRRLFETLAAEKAQFNCAEWRNFTDYACEQLLSAEEAVVHRLYCTFLLRRNLDANERIES